MASIRPYYDSYGNLKSFYIRVSNGRDTNGKILKYSTTTFEVLPTWSEKTARKKAEIFAADFEAQCRAGNVTSNNQTFAEYCDDFINVRETTEEIKPTTAYNYRELTKLIYPEIGNIKLKNLTVRDLKQLYAKLSQTDNKNYKSRALPKGKFGDLLKQKGITRKMLSEVSGVALHTVADAVNGKEISIKSAQAISDALDVGVKKLFRFTEPEPRKLSGTTVNACHRMIKTVLRDAVSEGAIPYSVADRIKKAPRKDHKDPVYYDFDQISKIRQELESVTLKWRTLVCLFLCTGCRRGEICGLKWENVNLEKKQINICDNLLYVPSKGIYTDTPKTESSNRKLTLPDEMVTLLKAYKDWQTKEKARLGDLFQDEGYLFPRENGQPMNPQSVNHWMKRFEEHCGFHLMPKAFRHSVASVLIFSGLDTVSTSRYMGHADVSTTTDIYAHIIQKANEKTARILSDVIFQESSDSDTDEQK